MLRHRFVEYIPSSFEEGFIYISVEYCTAIHKCVCGCGNEVVTPLSPTDWELTFNGKDISLYPSIGNWSFKCQSHYWIKNSEIHHSSKWDKNRIEEGRRKDRNIKKGYYNGVNEVVMKEEGLKATDRIEPSSKMISVWKSILNLIGLK